MLASNPLELRASRSFDSPEATGTVGVMMPGVDKPPVDLGDSQGSDVPAASTSPRDEEEAKSGTGVARAAAHEVSDSNVAAARNTFHSYVDYSREAIPPPDKDDLDSSNSKRPRKGSDPSLGSVNFVTKLYNILATPEFHEMICW
jgi:hypothetical protein